MAASSSEWNREELYEKVWQVPLRKLAAEFAISDVALGKICRRLQIPLPGLGHWTKVECGHAIERPPLPEPKNLPVIKRQISEKRVLVLPTDETEITRIEELERSTTPQFEKAMLVHPLLEKTRKVLTAAQTNDRGMLWAGREVDWLDVRVSEDCLERALRIMAIVVHLVEKEGFEIVVEKGKSESTSAIVYGEKVRLGLIEKSRQVKPIPTPSRSGYSYETIKLEPTGRLSLELGNCYYSRGLQRTWADGEKTSLEGQLPRCVAGMMRIALRERAERDAREKEEQARQKRIDEVRDTLRQIEDEEKKVRALKREAMNWHRAQRIRRYVTHVQEAAEDLGESEKGKALEWVAWALLQADRLDPTKEAPPSIVDNKQEALRRFRSVSGFG